MSSSIKNGITVLFAILTVPVLLKHTSSAQKEQFQKFLLFFSSIAQESTLIIQNDVVSRY